jgi:spermidine synthase
VDLDPAITDLFSQNMALKQLNDNALSHPKVTVVNQDAWTFLESQQGRFDVVIADLPDPNNLSLSRLYSREFYTLLSTRMADDGVFVTQATSPLYARHAFWSIVHSIESVQPGSLVARPYHAYIPTFGEWGFVMASKRPLAWPSEITAVTPRFLSPAILASLQNFAPDIAELDADVNTLIDHPLINYYEKGWEQWFRHLD